jgi:hypothetical protein
MHTEKTEEEKKVTKEFYNFTFEEPIHSDYGERIEVI